MHMAVSSLAGQLALPSMLADVAALERQYYETRARPWRSHAAGQLRHQRSSRLVADRFVQRSPHPGDHPGDLRLPATARNRRSALPGQGHACVVRARAADGAGSARRQRRAHRDPARRRGDPDSGHFARDPGAQPGARFGSRRRHRHHPVTQSAGGRRHQVQPDRRRPGGHGSDAGHPGSGERAAARGQRGRKAGDAVCRDECSLDAAGRPDRAVRGRPAQRGGHGRDQRGRPAPWRSIRWAARRCTTGSRSRGCTRSTSPW